MANGSVGEPLGWRHAVALYSAQTVRGTAVTPATACGIAKVKYTKQSANHEYRGPGSPNLVARKGGMTSVDWSMQFEAAQSGIKTLLTKAARSAGVLSYLTLGFGYKDDVTPTANKAADQIQDCKIDKISLGLDCASGHGPLTASLSGFGGLVTALTTLSPALDNTTPFMSYEGVFTKAGSAYELRHLSLEVNQNVTRDCVIPGAAPGSFLRGPKYLTERAEMITGQISRYAAFGTNVQSDSVPLSDLVLTLTNVDDATTLTLTLSSCDYDHEEVSEDDGGIFYTVPFRAKTWSIA